MALAYSKDFLVEVYASRFSSLGTEVYEQMKLLGSKYYDHVGKDKFRINASVDAEAIREYKREHIND